MSEGSRECKNLTCDKNDDEKECRGCINLACGQDEHMECPTGCLHDPNDCDICIVMNES